MLIDGSLAGRRELVGEEAFRLGALVAAGLAAGLALGHPVAAVVLAGALWIGWRVAGFAGVLAVCLGALALASAAMHDVKAAAMDERWVALGTLALWPVVSRRPVHRAVPPLLLAGGVGLGALAFLSTGWSVDPWLTLQRAASFAVLVWVALIVVPLHAGTPRERRDLVVALAALCGIGATGALVLAFASPDMARATPAKFAYFNGLSALPHFGPLRGWTESSNTIGIWCALLLPFLLQLRRRVVVVPLVLATIGVILWSYSRAALVVLVATLLWHAYSVRPRRVTLAAVIATAVVVITPLGTALVTNSALTKFNRAGRSERSLLGGRLEPWDATLDLIAAAPLSGFGFGTGDRLFGLSGANHRFVYFIGANSANGYLQALVEVGPLGAIAVVAALLGGLGGGLRRATRSRGRAPFVVTGVGVAVIGLTESVFTSAGSPFTLLMWSSLGVASATVLRPEHEDPEPLEDRRPAGGPSGEPLLDLPAKRTSEELVVATNGHRDLGVRQDAAGNGAAGPPADTPVQVSAQPEAKSRIPGDRPA